MKNLILLALFMVFIYWCSNSNDDIVVEKDNIGASIFKIDSDGMIAEAEKKKVNYIRKNWS